MFLNKNLTQTGPIFGAVLTVLVCLASSSLLSVVSYSALTLLTAVAAAKIYAFVMIKMGKVDATFDPLAAVRCINKFSYNYNTMFNLLQAANVTLTLPESAVKEHAPCVTSAINQVLAKAKSLFLLETPVSLFLNSYLTHSCSG